MISDTLTMLGYLFITMICFVYYSPDEIQKYNQPVINMLESIEFKVLERMEMLFIAFFYTYFFISVDTRHVHGCFLHKLAVWEAGSSQSFANNLVVHCSRLDFLHANF